MAFKDSTFHLDTTIAPDVLGLNVTSCVSLNGLNSFCAAALRKKN